MEKSRLSDQIDIEVLLATLNSEKYITEMIASIVGQIGVRVHLLVSDDGSTDHTIPKILEFADKFESVRVIDGPRSGASENFFHLIKNSNLDYIAFADHDDIWESNHLIDGLSEIMRFENLPALYYTAVLEFGDKVVNPRKWPSRNSIYGIPSIFFENKARGCTMVLNRKLADLVKTSDSSKAIMHDWWTFLIATTCGHVVYDEATTVRYRLHVNNLIGSEKHLLHRIAKHIIKKHHGKKEWTAISQFRELKKQLFTIMDKQSQEKILSLERALSSSYLSCFRLKYLVKSKFRTSHIESLGVAFFLLLRRASKFTQTL